MPTHTNLIASNIKENRPMLLKNSLKVIRMHCTFRCYIITSILGIIISIFSLQLGQNVAKAEYFSSIDVLQRLGDVEMRLLDLYRDYLEDKENEIDNFQRFIEHIKLQHSIAEEDVEDYLGNPINAFTLIKRMVIDWNNLHEFIKNSTSNEIFQSSIEELRQDLPIPDEVDLQGAIKGIVRLQKVYNLSSYDLADGIVNSSFSDEPLTWQDCFEIATNIFDLKEYSFALSWFETTLQVMNITIAETTEAFDLRRKFAIEVFEYLALTYNELGDSEKSLEYIDEILKVIPDHHTKDIRIYIINSPRKMSSEPIPYDHSIHSTNYIRLCRGIQNPEKRIRNLKCSVETRGKPQFILAPLKVEPLSTDPAVLIYHGLLTDVQIQQIILEAEEGMVRSEVLSTNGSISDNRTSQQAWLKYSSRVMSYIEKLIEGITGLDMKNGELMQVANYGIGGAYEPHFDYIEDPALFRGWDGDRIITNMFYLSNVEQGGYTVFPDINVFSRPQKGSMVQWYNLHKSLKPDPRTLHAGCPVITGSKRIGNVWIHSGHQEFRRPCGLKNDSL